MMSPRGCHSLRGLGGSTSKWCFVPLSLFAPSYSRGPPTVLVLTDWVARTLALGWGSLQSRTASRGIVPRCRSEDIADNASRRATGDSTKDFDRPVHTSAYKRRISVVRPPYLTSTSATFGSVRAARKSWISVVHRLGRKPEEQTTAGTPIQLRGSIRAIRRPMCRLASMV
jgi:hypothetical protein